MAPNPFGSFSEYHRIASENIIEAGRERDPAKLLDSIKWGTKALDHQPNDIEVVLALGLIRAAVDMYIVLTVAPETGRKT